MDGKNQLTRKEADVLKLIKLGLSNKEIAEALYISLETVKSHVKSILFKYDLHDRKKLIVNENHYKEGGKVLYDVVK